MNKRKISLLILSNYFRCPPRSGGEIRMVNPMLSLGKTGLYEATYLVQCQSNEEIERARQYFSAYPWVTVVATCASALPNIEEKSKHLQIPMEVFNAMDEPYYEALGHLLGRQQFDLIQVEHSWMSWVVPLIRTISPQTPVALDMLDIEFKRLERWLQYDPCCDRNRMQARLEKMRHWEKTTWQWYDACLAVSPIEAQEFNEATGNRIKAFALPVSGGTDIGKFSQSATREKMSAESMINIGTLIWYPNVHGLIWFIDRVMPLVKAKHPNARLYIAGFGGSWLQLMERVNKRNDIIFLGEIADEREILDIGSVFIAPIWIAAGARIKILTAWAAGIPVVANTIAAEGLNYTNGSDILIADDPESFAEAIVNLFDNPELAAKLVDNGRKLIESQYSTECAARQYDQAYSEIIGMSKNASFSTCDTTGFVGIEGTMRNLVQLKTSLQMKAICATSSFGFPPRLMKLLVAADGALPAAIKKTHIYCLGVAAVGIINRDGWRVFVKCTNDWLCRYFSRHIFNR